MKPKDIINPSEFPLNDKMFYLRVQWHTQLSPLTENALSELLCCFLCKEKTNVILESGEKWGPENKCNILLEFSMLSYGIFHSAKMLMVNIQYHVSEPIMGLS